MRRHLNKNAEARVANPFQTSSEEPSPHTTRLNFFGPPSISFVGVPGAGLGDHDSFGSEDPSQARKYP